MHLLFSAYFAVFTVFTAYVSIPGIVHNATYQHDQKTITWEKCKNICDTYPACQAYYHVNTTSHCITYDYNQLESFDQLDQYPPTQIWTFKTNITTCSYYMPTVFYTTYTNETNNISANYIYTKNGTLWTTKKI
ncbi:unnamed protein product [Caenorhabditis angaria]|uniref:Uncharacterized protein n=1 Tax=Caenorhabditis angaria TaxID=860376 RepID=A0A9P1N0A7_9PELO|nr:unnamed protein product [Caenorhabditis angaria]